MSAPEGTCVSDPRDTMVSPFGDWSGDSTMYVDGRVTRNQARHIVCEEVCGWYRVTTARRCYMRLLTGAEALEFTDGECDEFFAVCDKNDPGAFAMWRVA